MYQTHPYLGRYSNCSASWKTRRFQYLVAGMGYQVNPGRTGNHWQQKVNGVMLDFYELVRPLEPDAPQTQEGSGGIQTNAEKAAARTSCGDGWSICWVPVRGGGLIPKQVDPPRFIGLAQVIEMTTLAKPMIYKYMAKGTFPKQIQLRGKSTV